MRGFVADTLSVPTSQSLFGRDLRRLIVGNTIGPANGSFSRIRLDRLTRAVVLTIRKTSVDLVLIVSSSTRSYL